jgi:hypothetical protein
MGAIHENKVKLFVRVDGDGIRATPWNKLKPAGIIFHNVSNTVGRVSVLINIKARHRYVRAARQKHLTAVTSVEPNLQDRLDVILIDELTNSLSLLRVILHMTFDMALTIFLHILGKGLHTKN